MSQVSYRVYTDGSASTLGCKAGGYAAVILRDGELDQIAWGGWAPTTIGKMEMHAIIAALEYIRTQPDADEAGIEVWCDRQDVVMSATGQYARRSNKEEWRRFDRAARGLNVAVTHIARNILPEQAKCDEISGQVRIRVAEDPSLKFERRTHDS